MGKIQAHRYKELRLGQLRAFCECVRHRSFTEAAKVLGVSHASVWQQIRALEREYGVALLERHGREMTPTDDGHLLLEMAGSVVASVDSLKLAFEERRGRTHRSLTVIGTPGTIAEELSEPVVAFYRRYPNIRVQLSTHTRIPPLIDAIVSGNADLGVLPLDEVGLASSGRVVEVEHLCIRSAVLVVPESHPLASRRRITLADIVRYPLILPEPETYWRLKVEEVLRVAGLLDRLQVLMEVTLSLAARRFVSLGLGAALLPLPHVGLAYPNIRVLQVDRLLPAETIAIVWRSRCDPAAASSALHRLPPRADAASARREVESASGTSGIVPLALIGEEAFELRVEQRSAVLG